MKRHGKAGESPSPSNLKAKPSTNQSTSEAKSPTTISTSSSFDSSTEKLAFDWYFYIISILPLIPSFFVTWAYIQDAEIKNRVFISFVFAVIACILTWYFIPEVAKYTLKRGLKGKDLGKRGTTDFENEIPEALGLVTGVVFLVCTIVWHFYTYVIRNTVDSKDVLHLNLQYHSALFSICFMIFLGFTDDTLDLPWRVKMFIPLFASLPLLATYDGATSVIIPAPFDKWLWDDKGLKLTHFGNLLNIIFDVDKQAFGRIIELGIYFKFYMASLAIFCTNAINILAGINGLECGQSYIIACSILFFKIWELSFETSNQRDALFAISIIFPFLGTALGLLFYNWFPAKVFVGDTFCYFAGMTFAVVGIHGHFSKTLLLLFTPQIINFVLSIPQLFKLMPCPRHRLPGIDEATRLMKPSTFECKANEWRWLKVRPDDVECPNCTIICAILRICGPLKERQLTTTLLTIQILTSVVVFYIRYILFGTSK